MLRQVAKLRPGIGERGPQDDFALFGAYPVHLFRGCASVETGVVEQESADGRRDLCAEDLAHGISRGPAFLFQIPACRSVGDRPGQRMGIMLRNHARFAERDEAGADRDDPANQEGRPKPCQSNCRPRLGLAAPKRDARPGDAKPQGQRNDARVNCDGEACDCGQGDTNAWRETLETGEQDDQTGRDNTGEDVGQCECSEHREGRRCRQRDAEDQISFLRNNAEARSNDRASESGQHSLEKGKADHGVGRPAEKIGQDAVGDGSDAPGARGFRACVLYRARLYGLLCSAALTGGGSSHEIRLADDEFDGCPAALNVSGAVGDVGGPAEKDERPKKERGEQ